LSLSILNEETIPENIDVEIPKNLIEGLNQEDKNYISITGRRNN